MGIISVFCSRSSFKKLQARLESELFQTLRGADVFDSSSVESRLEDIHEAFADLKIKAILTTIGGYNSIHLLKNLDYELIKRTLKFCVATPTLLHCKVPSLQRPVL